MTNSNGANNNGKVTNNPTLEQPERVLGQSVQQGDIAKYLGSGVVQFLVPAFGAAYAVDAIPPQLPQAMSVAPYSKSRDIILSQLPIIEGNWASAVDVAITKLVARGTQLESPVSRRIDNVNEMLQLCDGRQGFDSMMERSLQDYFNTSNGCWFEIERAYRSPAAKIVTINHLDSLRVWRTGDPDIPAIYWDLKGRYHELAWWECFSVCDLKSARAGWWYGGECAGERGYKDIRAVAAMTAYFDEKITGSGFSKIVFVQNATNDQLLNAITVAKSENAAKGIAYYQGVVMVPVYGDTPIDVAKSEIMLKGMPDNWDREKELEIRQIAYAVALGISPLDVNPRLTARGAMGTGQQSQVLDDAERGRVGAKFIREFARNMNTLVTPDATVFAFPENDLRDEKMQAEIAQIRAQTRAAMRGTTLAPGELSPMQSLFLAVESEDAPREFLDATTPVDQTLTDQEKPLSESDAASLQSAEQRQSAQQSAPDDQPDTTDAAPPQEPARAKEARTRGRFVSRSGLPAVWQSAQVPQTPEDAAHSLLLQELPRARALARHARLSAEQPVAQTKEMQPAGMPNISIAFPAMTINPPAAPNITVNNQVQPTPVSVAAPHVEVTNQVQPAPQPLTVKLPEIRPQIMAAPAQVSVQPAANPAPVVTVTNEVNPTPITNQIELPREEVQEWKVIRDSEKFIDRIRKTIVRRGKA